jgi:hypothetical protein
MPHTVTLEPQHRFVRVTYIGTTTLAERLAAMQDATRLMMEAGYRRVLVDLTAAVAAPEALNLGNSFATAMAMTPPMQESRLAYVVDPREHANRLIENFASARHVTLRRFHDGESALRWLLEDGDGGD